MADIPKHLLERAAARRAAMAGGGSGEPVADAAKSDAPPQTTAVAKVAPAAAAAPVASKPAPEPVVAAPKGAMFSKFASVFLLASVPIWGFFMFDSFATPQVSASSPATVGSTLFASNCSACHLSDGSGKQGGGTGRPLWKGIVEKTFPNPVDQVAFVKHGSCAAGTPYGDPKAEGGQHIGQQIGVMPSFKSLTDEQIIAIVSYERYVLNGKDFPKNMLAKVGEDATKDPATPIDYAALTTELAKHNVCSEK